jgi:hypothetical protein
MSRTIRTEFPDYGPLADIRFPNGFVDTSWHNDACPSIEGFGLRIWLDYAEPERREMGSEHPRFTVVQLDAEGELDSDPDALPLFMSDHWSEVFAFLLARRFAANIHEVLTDDQLNTVNMRNRAASNANTCATHDFCDANIEMDAAFSSLMGRSFDCDSADDALLWNAAWDMAKRAGFREEALNANAERAH